jgi:hypothetical protein
VGVKEGGVQPHSQKKNGGRQILISLLAGALVVLAAWYGLTKLVFDGEQAPNEGAETAQEESVWRDVDFMIPDNRLWRDTSGGIYTAVGSEDAFAWSLDPYQGNLSLSFDLVSSQSKSSGCVIVFGDGQGFSRGNLIFCVDWDGYGLEKHTIYHEGENRITFIPDDVDLKDNIYSVTIEIVDDVASMVVNGDEVFSSFFDPGEIADSGRVGLLKKWFDQEITFSNIQIKTTIE